MLTGEFLNADDEAARPAWMVVLFFLAQYFASIFFLYVWNACWGIFPFCLVARLLVLFNSYGLCFSKLTDPYSTGLSINNGGGAL